jgi:hypothetical protein
MMENSSNYLKIVYKTIINFLIYLQISICLLCIDSKWAGAFVFGGHRGRFLLHTSIAVVVN